MTLGQAGVLLRLGSITVFIDPYLSDSVADTFGEQLRRLAPAPLSPSQVVDADWVLVTHEHLDHADPDTLQPLSAASPAAMFLAAPSAAGLLEHFGINRHRIIVASEDWTVLAPNLRVRAVPAAHLDLARDDAGRPWRVGFLLEWHSRLIYHAGDTVPHPDIVASVKKAGRPEVAFIPVNERNYFRDAAGIIGNMSVREAYAFAELLGVGQLVPIHWDLFAPNTTPVEELVLMYDLLKPTFALRVARCGQEVPLP